MLLLAMAGSGVGDFLYSLVIQKLLKWYAAEEEGCSGGGEDTPCDAWRSVMRLAGCFSMILAVASSFVLRLPEPGEVEKYEEDYELDEELESLFIEKRYGSIGQTSIPGSKEEEEEDAYVVVVKDEEGEVVIMHKDRRAHFGRGSSVETLGGSFRSRYDQTHNFQLCGCSSSIRPPGVTSENNATGSHQGPTRRRLSLAEFEALGMLPVRISTLQGSTTDVPTPGLPYLSLAEVLDTNTPLHFCCGPLRVPLCIQTFTFTFPPMLSLLDCQPMTAPELYHSLV